MNWNLLEYLPEEAGCRESFKVILAGFINAVHTHLSGLDVELVPQVPVGSQPSTQRMLGLGTRGNAAEFAEKLLVEHLSQKLFE